MVGSSKERKVSDLLKVRINMIGIVYVLCLWIKLIIIVMILFKVIGIFLLLI